MFKLATFTKLFSCQAFVLYGIHSHTLNYIDIHSLTLWFDLYSFTHTRFDWYKLSHSWFYWYPFTKSWFDWYRFTYIWFNWFPFTPSWFDWYPFTHTCFDWYPFAHSWSGFLICIHSSMIQLIPYRTEVRLEKTLAKMLKHQFHVLKILVKTLKYWWRSWIAKCLSNKFLQFA